MMLHGSLILKHLFQRCQVNMLDLIDDDTAAQYFNDIDTATGDDLQSKSAALEQWATIKKREEYRDRQDHIAKIYTDFDKFSEGAGLSEFSEDARYQFVNSAFVANETDGTAEDQMPIYPSKRDEVTDKLFGKTGLSEKETFGLIKQSIDARNEVTEAANQIPGDIALSLFDSIGGGDPVDVPKLIETWKTKNAESIKKLPPGWEAPLLESAQAFHTETEGMLRDYAEPLKKVYDHLAAVTGRDTERAGETNPKNQEEMDSMVDTLASMPKPVRERAYASVVLGAQKAGQDPKTFMDQWGESWSRTLNMVRTGALTAQEMSAESDLRMLENKETPPDYFISKSTGEKIPLANSAFHDEADLRKVTPEEIAADAAKARQKVKRFEVIRELKNVADNQFDPIEKINKGGFLGFMESMAYGSPQGLAITATALVPFVGPYLAGAAMFSDEYDQLRSQGMNVDQAIQVGSVSAAIQAGMERTGAKALFGKLPVFEKLMRKIGNPARVGKAGSAGVRFLTAATGEQLVEGAQDLTTPLVQDVAEALGADVPDVKWQPILEKWEGSRLDVLAASLPTIFFGTGVASFADNKRFAQFEERQDIYRMTGMDDAAIKKIEDGKDLAEVQQNFQTEFGKLTPENVKAGVSYIEGKITSAQEQQQDSNTHTLTRETLADGSKKFVIRDPKGEVTYSTADAQTAQIAISELLRNQITGTTRGIAEAMSFLNRWNESIGRGEDIQKFLLSDAPRDLLNEYEANPTEKNLDNLFQTVGTIGKDISEPAELANFPVLASNQGVLAEGIFKSVIRIYGGATGDKVVRDFSQDNLKRAIAEQRITMDWVRENLNQVIPLIDSERITGHTLRTDTDTDVIESFSDVALAYMTGRIREEQIPAGFRGFLRRMAIVVKDIYRRAYNLKRAIAEGKVDANFESFLADSVGLNQQARVDTASQRVAGDVLADTDGKVVFSRAQAQSNAGEIRASNATITGPANYSIAAHHGTPHKVDKFTTGKIGTGEGAQAYGWGLYFAEEKKVATGYRDALSGVKLLDAKGEVLVGLTSNPVTQKILKEAQSFWKNGETTLPSIISEITQRKRQAELWASSGSNVQSNTEFVSGSEEAIRLLQGGSSAKVDGNLYTVDLDVEPEDLLDWDKPLSEQTESVRDAVTALIKDRVPKEIADVFLSNSEAGGGSLYTLISDSFGESAQGTPAKRASEALLAAGIPGIRYLDEGSRGQKAEVRFDTGLKRWLVEWDEGFGRKQILSSHQSEQEAKIAANNDRTYNYVAFDEKLIKITEENGNRIAAADALAAPDTSATNYSIGMTVAPLRRDSLSELNKKEMQKRASSAKFIHLQQVIDDVANAYGVKIESRQPVIGGWVEGGQISLEVPEAVLFDTDDLEMAQEMAAIVGASAPELQNAVMLWKDDDAGKDTVLEFQAKGADSALAIAKDLNAAGLNGFTYDTKNRKFSLVLAGLPPESVSKVYDFIDHHTKQGGISTRGGTQTRAGVAAFPSESDYRRNLQGARSRAGLLQQGQREALLDVVDRAERRIDRYAAALKISEQAKKIQKKLKRPSTSALDIETELKGKKFDNIRQLGLYLDSRFNKVFGKPSFEIGGQEGIDIASDAFVYDIIDGLAGDGSGMGWYDERVQETIRELSKLHPEFATDSNALAVYIGILATTSQGYTVVENFKQANKVYNEYKRTGRIPEDFKFAKSSEPINSNLAQIQGLIDEHGLDGYAEFMDQEVTGQALREQFGKTPTGVTLKDKVRGNRVLGPKIGSFFNNLRGQFDTITMDLWYTRTMHRFLGETVVPLDSEKMQNAITKFREELKKDGVRTYGIDLTEALKDDEATVQAGLTLFQRWARGDNEYTEKGYFKFPDGYKIEKFARGIFSIGGMKGAPQNKTHRQYFAKVVLEAKAKLAKLGMKLTEADMQAIIWYREKNLFARTGVANAAAKPADYLDAVMVARSGAQVQEDVDPADLESEDGDTNYSIASQSEIDRVNKALGGMNRGPDERLKVYQRAKQKFSKLMAWNSDELAAMADTGSDESQIRRTQILQALGELDGILSVLPPEVRGRVGGYTKLAGIAPMDVLKDGVKISEVSGMKGALISAWMDQGLNIGQAGKKVDFPPGYTATENLSTKRADKVIADFFRDRIKRMDTELEKVLVREYTEAITKVVKQSRPKAGDNGVRKSTLGAETQKFADTVLRATLLDDEATAKRMAEIEAALTMPDATAEDISALSEEWSILNTFGDLDNRSSETLAQGLDWLKGQFQMGREAWRIKEQARIDEQRARNAATIEWLGKGTAKKRFADKGLMQRIGETANNYLLDHGSFEQFVSAFLPQEIASNFSERLRKADMAAQSAEIRDGKGIIDAVRAGAKAANMSAGDAMLWLKSDQKNAVSYLEGRKVKDERIAIDLAQKIVTGEADRSKLTDSDVETLRNELAALPADTQKEFVTIKRVIFRGEDVKLDMSRAKAMQLLLSWNQPDVQIKMRKEGWTDDSAADLKALVNDPVSREVMAYAKELYGKGAGIVNPVYSRMFGMNMPQVKNYAPTRFINAKDTKDIGIDGSPSATGTTPGFAKSRVTHSAKIAPEDALTVMQGHIAQQAHWVHFAELAREFRAILSNPEVRESLKQTHGDGVLKSAELWADQLEQRGGNKAKEIAWFNPILGTVLSGKAVSSLGFNLKTLAMQLDNTVRFGLALDMRQIVSALSNPSTIVEDIQTVWESDALQNRLQGGATAEARFLFSRYAGKPNFAAKIAEASMTPINWLDSAGTSISSAIVYRANLNDALAAGMPEALAKQTALDSASQAIYRFAQPVSFGQKSIVENNANVMGKMFFLFMSDARLKTAILADAARGLATGRGDKGTHMRRILAIETMAVLSHVVSSAFRDGLSDDDDDDIWNLGGFAKAILLAPLQGYFFAGTLGELAISKLTGQKTFNSTTQNPLLSSMEQAARAGNNLEDALNLDDPDAMTKEWNNIFRSMALSPAMAAPAVLLNMVKPVMGLYENAKTED